MCFMLKVLCLLLCLFSFVIGKSIQNFQFTDMNGKVHDLYDMLDEGKHIYVFTTYND